VAELVLDDQLGVISEGPVQRSHRVRGDDGAISRREAHRTAVAANDRPDLAEPEDPVSKLVRHARLPFG
jgi:hypothetical protein